MPATSFVTLTAKYSKLSLHPILLPLQYCQPAFATDRLEKERTVGIKEKKHTIKY